MLPHVAGLTAPLFLLVLLGAVLSRMAANRVRRTDALRVHRRGSHAALSIDERLRSAAACRCAPPDRFLRGCLVVYVVGRVVGAWLFRMDGSAVFAVSMPVILTLLGHSGAP